MTTDPLDSPNENAPSSAPHAHLLGPRKRIVSHEVSSTSLSTEPVRLSELESNIIVARPRPLSDPMVVDPTIRLGERQRRRSQNWAYQLTAATALLAFVTASAAIALLLADYLIVAKLVAVTAVVLSIASLRLTHHSLARRRRGYAIAAVVLASVALVMNLASGYIHDSISEIKTTVTRVR